MNTNFSLHCQLNLATQMPLSLCVGRYVIGRSSKSDIVVKHDTVSRFHAEIVISHDAGTFRDLGSRNGTFVDARRMNVGALQVGQQLKFGDAAFLVMGPRAGNEEQYSDVETATCDKEKARLSAAYAELSKAQHRVLTLFLRGLAEKQVAAKLNLSSATVHNHLQAIYQIFKVHSRSELLVLLLGNIPFS